MLQPDFSFYAQEICKGIKSRQKREDVIEELICHLEDNYERNLSLGMNEDEAKADAIKKMGDGNTLAYRLSSIHSYSPSKEMSSAFISLIVAYIGMNFFLTSSVKEILFLAGIPTMFSPLMRMRKMNGTVEKAFHLFNLYVLTRLFFYCIGLGRVLPFWADCIDYVISNVSQGLFWMMLFKGLFDFCQPYLTKESKKPHLIFCGVYHMLISFFTGFILILSEGEKVDIPAFLFPLFIVFMFFFCIAQLVRVRKILWDADGEYGILPSDGKQLGIFAGVIFACLVTVFGFNYFSATAEPIKTELVIHDLSEAEQKEADQVREKLLSWNVHKQVIDDLPDSEILKYKAAEFVTWGADGGTMGGSQYSSGCQIDVYYYWFFFPDNISPYSYDVRLLCYIDSHYSKDAKSFYRKGFYYAPLNNIIPLNKEDMLNDTYISIVTDKGGIKYTAEPFIIHKLDDYNITEWPKGFEYREEKGQRVYFATDIGVQNLDNFVQITATTIKQRWICTLNYNTTADYAESFLEYGKVTTRSGKYMPYYWRNHSIATGEFDESDIEMMRNHSQKID